MPRYKITDPSTGKTFRLTGDSPPSEQELNEIFSSVGQQEKPSTEPEYQQGFLKTYEGQPQGFLQNADVMAGKVANLGMNAIQSPFEMAGEAMRGAGDYLMGQKTDFNAPKLFGGQGAQDPFGYANKVARTAVAGLSAPLRGQGMAQQAQAEYDRPQSNIDTMADVTLGIGSSFVAPRVANAPMEAIGSGASRIFEGLGKARSGLRERMVAPNARRALGKFPEGMSTQEANQVGLTAMDQGVIKNPLTNPLSSGRASMLKRADTINESIGENIGKFLSSQDEGLDASRAMKELDQVKSEFMNDPVIVRKVEQAKNLISKNSKGSGKEIFHGTDKTFKEFDLKKSSDGTVWFTDSRDAIESGDVVASGRGKIMSRFIDESKLKLGGWDEYDKLSTAELKARGYDGLKLPDEGETTYRIFNPKKLARKIDESSKSMGFTEANKLKGLFQKKVNYGSDAATGDAGKAIAGNFRNSIDTQLDELAAKLGNKEGMESFKSDKKLFGQTRKMQDVLEKQAKRDERNMPISLPSTGIGIGGLITGGGLKGISMALVAEWVKKYGNATAASMLNDVANALGSAGKSAKTVESSLKSIAPLGVAASVTNSKPMLKKRKLDKQTARMFYEQAGGDKEEARRLAAEAGY